jgi:nucleotide-binding universal stress UspA family protein
MIYLAYDGSVNGDWIARYAIRMAANSREQQLRVLSVDDGHLAEADYLAKVERLDRECRAAGVTCNAVRLPLQGTVADSLIAAIEPGAEQLLVCGARVRSRDRGYFSGTVSNELMRWRRCNVVALRVVQPGLLGMAQYALIPIGGSEAGVTALAPFLKRLIPGIERIELLRVVEIASWRFRRISPEAARRERRGGIQRVHDA